MARQQTAPKPLRDILAESPGLTPAHRVSWWIWRDVVGERVAIRSQPDRLEGNTLLVTVQGSAWAQELSLLAPLILKGLRARRLCVESLRFRVGQLQIPARPKLKNVAQPRSLSPELRRCLDKLAGDPELQAAIAEAASLCGQS